MNYYVDGCGIEPLRVQPGCKPRRERLAFDRSEKNIK